MKMYHAATGNYSSLKPMGYDLGNSLQKPGWSLFCFRKEEYSKGWAVFQFVKKHRKEMKINPTWSVKHHKLMITMDMYNRVCDYVETTYEEMPVYVYEFNIPCYKVGVGNDSSHHEYTVREEITEFDVTRIDLDVDAIYDNVAIVSEDEYYQYSRDSDNGKFVGARGLLGLLQCNDYQVNYAVAARALEKGLKKDRLHVGDDITTFLKGENVIKRISIMDRIKTYISNTI